MPDEVKTQTRCISFESMNTAICKKDLYILNEKNGTVVQFGALWAGDNDETLRRTVRVVKQWFNVIKTMASDWWELGSSDGGGLAMNDGVTVAVNVMRSVVQSLECNGANLVNKTDDELFELLKPYAEAMAEYLGSLNMEERRDFRSLRGVQGQTTRTKRCWRAIHEKIPQFEPAGLSDFIQEELAQTNDRARSILANIEKRLQLIVVSKLVQEFGASESGWWTQGIPLQIRQRVRGRSEEDNQQRGGLEFYFDLIDYRTIAVNNWVLFSDILSYAKGGKEKATEWMVHVNDRRKIVAHPGSGVMVSLDQLAELEQINTWLEHQVQEISPSLPNPSHS